jgi:tetratricopeptide (TPR) repeat protein
MPVFVTERYRLAAAPGLMILGAGGLWVFWDNLISAQWGGLTPDVLQTSTLWQTLRLARWPAAAAYVVLAVGAGWFVSIPRADISLWSLDFYKAGIRSTIAGNLDRAQWNLEAAFAYVPNNEEINFALGNLWLAKSHRAADKAETIREQANAKVYYRRALDLNPRHAGTLNNLGVMFKDERRWDAAEWCFTHAIEADPGDATKLYLLAIVRLEQRKRAEAQAALDEALKLRPQQKEFLQLQEKLRNSTPPSAELRAPDSPKPAPASEK